MMRIAVSDKMLRDIWAARWCEHSFSLSSFDRFKEKARRPGFKAIHGVWAPCHQRLYPLSSDPEGFPYLFDNTR